MLGMRAVGAAARGQGRGGGERGDTSVPSQSTGVTGGDSEDVTRVWRDRVLNNTVQGRQVGETRGQVWVSRIPGP